MSVFRKTGKGSGEAVPDENPTRVFRRPDHARSSQPELPGQDDSRTRLVGPSRNAEGAGSGKVTDAMDDPVVGWVVVVDGPGRGADRRLGYGINRIGRGPECRVILDFGDDKISRVPHCLISFDPKSGCYYLQHGDGQNLTYLGDSPVLAPVELKGGERFTIGQTTLLFVPFSDLVWQDET